jgi:hypothetical protein
LSEGRFIQGRLFCRRKKCNRSAGRQHAIRFPCVPQGAQVLAAERHAQRTTHDWEYEWLESLEQFEGVLEPI